ncbi:ABC transporter permease [soil metagenome]
MIPRDDEPRWRRYLRFWGSDPRADVEDELAFHIQERAAWNERRGLSPEDAQAEADRRFGDFTHISSECIAASQQEVRRMTWHDRLGDVARDVRVASRSLARAPIFTMTAVAALALGIGANTAVFTVVSSVLLRPLPYAEAERVVAVYNSWNETPQAGLSPAEYLDYAERVRAFEHVGVYAGTFVNLIAGDVAERVPGAVVTPSALRALGVATADGRLFSEDEGLPGNPGVVLLSYAFWHARFNGSPEVIGSSLDVNGLAMTVVGVLAAGVRLPDDYADAEPAALIVPLGLDRTVVSARGSHFLAGVARLAPGWTIEAATEEASRVARQIVVEYPDDYPAEMRFDTYVRPIHADVFGETRSMLLLLMGAVALVLLIACANVAGLVMTRTEERRRELAVRTALGASRWRLARQLLLEHLLLAGLAGAAGAGIGYVGVRALTLLRPEDIPRLDEIGIDIRVLAFTAALSILVTLIVSLVPLRAGARTSDAWRDAGGRTTTSHASRRARHALIMGEVALSIVLVAGAALLLRSFSNLLSVDPGYRTEQLLSVPVTLPAAGYQSDDARRNFFAQLVDAAAALPGVNAAGAVINLPLATSVGDLNIRIEGRAVREGDVSPRLDWQVITPGWFDAMGMDIVSGRGILSSDDVGSPGAVVISESAARKYWPGEDPIGRRFVLGGEAGPGQVTVVGVVRDVRHGTLSDEPPALMYLPHAQFTFWNGGAAPAAMTLVVHTAGPPFAMLQPLRDLVRRMDAQVPLGTARSMEQVVSSAVAEPRFVTGVLGSFAVLALALALIGIYGLVAYTVARRTREIAVRMALGAEPRGVVRQMLLQGMRPVFAGIVIGGVAAMVLTRMLGSMLYGVTPHDPATLAGTLVLVTATAALACLLPARRAARVAPMGALRQD